MSISVKGIAGALLLALGSTAANAAVDNAPSTGDGNAFITIVNTQAQTSYVIDLNRTLTSLAPNQAGGTLTPESGLTFSINLGVEVGQFITAAASNLYSWWIAAADSAGLGNFGGRRLLTTGDVGLNVGSIGFTNQGATQAANAVNTFVGSVNAQCATGDACSSTSVQQGYGYQSTWRERWNTNLPAGLNNGAGISEPQGFYYYATPESATATSFGTPTRFAYANAAGVGTWALALNGLGEAILTYSIPAVPVPAAVWLLLSGLVGLTAVGRRKAAAAAVA